VLGGKNFEIGVNPINLRFRVTAIQTREKIEED